MRVKYVISKAVESGDVTTLEPGQSIAVEHDLSKAYNFTIPGQGLYVFKPKNIFYAVNLSTNKVTTLQAQSTAVHKAQIAGKLVHIDDTPVLRKREQFNGCSDKQERDIYAAADDATVLASDSALYLNVRNATERYTTWFGEYDSSRFDTVQDHFDRISNNTFDSFTYDCTCNKTSVFAYVYPNRFGEIFLCPQFWKAPLTGTDSKAGTIVHESSHFTANGGTKDYTYGQGSCKKLAIDQPDQAVFNADSHEYFAENTPTLL
ncbi:hypothetical protein AX17_003177 [Amanita inopinata Kibby_2008]|nr:hypothetical protein AX17_003177 [Amanita inopinata Kibby_2008]